MARALAAHPPLIGTPIQAPSTSSGTGMARRGRTTSPIAVRRRAGARIARHAAEKRLSREVNGQARTLDEILASSNKAYAIDYSEVTEIVLKKKALPIGHSRCKIQSRQKDTTLAFKLEMFDEASAVLAEVLPGRVTIR